ncbi:hypothetical protein MAR_018336 [Mya arenaria]|uniref:Uncharacterized protein n=1 Tax=Mya arenaria TaxID=6604 RepID=A0ABY7EIA1_MYAAR|nr:hypothetical protein MAR_018336 [Mya arenaria]
MTGFQKKSEKQKDVGILIINTLTDVCWFLDPFIERFEKRCINIPKVWKFHGFRDWRSQHKKPLQISSEELAKKSNALAKVFMLPWWLNRSFSAFKDSVSELLSAMEYYHKSLADQLERTQRNHYSSTPVRSVADNWGLTVIEVDDLRSKILERLPLNTPAPSASWIRLNFMPSNQFSASALNYTRRFNVP